MFAMSIYWDNGASRIIPMRLAWASPTRPSPPRRGQGRNNASSCHNYADGNDLDGSIRRGWLRSRAIFAALIFALSGLNAFAETGAPAAPTTGQADFAKRAEKAYQAAKTRFDAQTNNAD